VFNNELIEHPLTVFGVADVGFVPRGLLANRLNRSDRFVGFNIANHVVDSNISAMLSEELSDAGSDTASRPSDKSLFAFKKFCCHVFALILIALVVHLL
jgi:hypothetical protein